MNIRTAVLALLPLWLISGLGAQEAWTPFDDVDNRRHPERVRTIDVEHYDISIRLDDRRNGEIEGRAAVRLAPLGDADRVELDAEDMTFASVTLPDGAPLKFQAEKGKVVVDLGRTAKKGEPVSLTFAYTGRPKHGLFWVVPDEGYPDRPWMVWSQGETNYNHHWFPCYDFPNDRATWEVRVTYPSKYLSVSNGELTESKAEGEWKTDHWKQGVPASTYLVSLIVGDLQRFDDACEVDGRKIPLAYAVPRGAWAEADVRASFGRTGAMVRFFSEKTGVAYPYPGYAQTVVNEFIWGGMENLSATTLESGAVVPARAKMDRDSDGLIAHELSHQWVGDLVTCRDWAHVWLNEGFATYFEALWRESVEGADGLAEDLAGAAGWYFGQMAEYDRPIVCDVYTDADDLFDACSYAKGAWVLHMLRRLVGDADWWKGIRLFLSRHREQVVETKDFVAVMEEVSGRDLDGFFDQWLHRLGHPELEIRAEWRAADGRLVMTVEQMQEVTEVRFGSLVTGTPVFRMPADVEVATKSGRKTFEIAIEKAKQEFVFELSEEPLSVLFDPEGWLLKTIAFAKTQEELRRLLLDDGRASVRRWAAEQLGDAVKIEPESLAALGKALADRSPWVARAAAERLGYDGTDGARRALLGARVRDARSRAAVYEALSHFLTAGDEEVGKALLEAVETDESPACRAAAAAALGRRGAEAFDQLKTLAWRFRKDELILPGVLRGLRDCGDPRGAKLLADSTKYGLAPEIRRRAAECLGETIEKHELFDGKETDALIALVDDPSFRIREIAVESLAELQPARALPVLEKRLPLETDGRLIREIRKAIERIKLRCWER